MIATNLVAGVWGGVAWLRPVPRSGFWYALRAAQVAVVLQVALGAILLLSGREAELGLHYLYGVLPLGISLLAEGVAGGGRRARARGTRLRVAAQERQQAIALEIVRRETGIMAVSALVILGLAIRAATTGG